MLEHLRDKEKQPSELELDFLYVIRSLLNEGWIMNKEAFFTIMETIDIESQTNHPVKNLIKILRKDLNIKEKIYRKWLSDHGAVLIKYGNLVTSNQKSGNPLAEIVKSPGLKSKANLAEQLGSFFTTQDSKS